MPRPLRYIRSKKMFHLALRVREGIPFVALSIMRLILQSAIARAQRDCKVILCDYLWMGNHVHMIFVSLDAEACNRFYQEVQKKVTESMKRLIGIPRLLLWEGDAMLAEVADLKAAIRAKAYLFANPAKADLVDSVSDYPGESSWEAFISCTSEISASVSRMVPWIHYNQILRAPGRSLTERQDRFLCNRILSQSKDMEKLELFPNAWMKVFGIEDHSQVARVNQMIRKRLDMFEEEAREKRLLEGRRVVGKERLKRQEILRPHTPKKRRMRVFVISSCIKRRIEYIRAYKEICTLYADCREKWNLGDFSVQWPPGTFPPSPGVRASAIA